MKKKNDGQSNSFRAPLLELVIIIGIFAIVSVYLLRMFMVADRFQGKAVATTKSIVKAESVVEFIRGTEASNTADLAGKLQAEFGLKSSRAKEYVINYDKSWKETETAGAYILVVNLSESKDESGIGTKVSGNVCIYSSDRKENYCDIPFVKYVK